MLEQGLGVYDATDAEVDAIMDRSDGALPAVYVFADIISRRAQVGWSTHGHSAVDVNIYASKAKHARPLIGNHENTEIGDFIREYLGVDLEGVTNELKEKGALLANDWMGKPVEDVNTLAELDHYAGDFKKRGLEDCGCGLKH